MKKPNLIFGNVVNVAWKHGELQKMDNNYLFIQDSVSTILIDVTPFVITIDVETG